VNSRQHKRAGKISVQKQAARIAKQISPAQLASLAFVVMIGLVGSRS
jgi:hypothetical protein